MFKILFFILAISTIFLCRFWLNFIQNLQRVDLINKLLEEYRDTKIALELGIDVLKEKDYAQGKLDLVNVIIKH